MTVQQKMKAIRLLQERAIEIERQHNDIRNVLDDIRRCLQDIDGVVEVLDDPQYVRNVDTIKENMSIKKELPKAKYINICSEAEQKFNSNVKISDIISPQDRSELEECISKHVSDFNRRYSLDGWDYAIAGTCGLFAAMLDLLCIQSPLKPTTAWTRQVDGTFNQWVQSAFNALLPPDISEALSNANPIGSADSSNTSDLIGAPEKPLNPYNHRLRSLAHDPVLGFIFGVLDMKRGTCTTVVDGRIECISSRKAATDGSVFQLLGRMLGHLLSDVNAPSAIGNRGMGIPAPFMGLLRMLEGIPAADSSFGKQIEWMFVNGYDSRQFAVTSIPMSIMEVLLRAFYVGKQMELNDASFAETMLDTCPGRLSPRFRMMLALAYGTSSAVNAGKIYITGNILSANYASWMGLVWNGFHAFKWALIEKHLKLWKEFEQKEIEALEKLVLAMNDLEERATYLPV